MFARSRARDRDVAMWFIAARSQARVREAARARGEPKQPMVCAGVWIQLEPMEILEQDRGGKPFVPINHGLQAVGGRVVGNGGIEPPR